MKTKLTCIVLLLVTILFTSCENFLNAGKVSEDIKSAIDYNNAKSVTVAIECDKNMGTVFPSPSYQAKLGYAFEIQFVPNLQNYAIIDPATIFEAVSRVNNDESRSGCVEFKVVEQTYEDERNGLYRVQAKVIKDSADILIRPACYILPKVAAVTPSFITKGVPVNNNVSVTFNTPMDIQSVKDNLLIVSTDKSNVDIIMNDYFEAPVFDETGTILTFVPKVQDIIDLMNRPNVNSTYIDIQFVFNEQVKGETGISLVQNSTSSFKVRFTPDIEDTKPLKQVLFASRSQPSRQAPESHPEEARFFDDLPETQCILEDAVYKQKVLRNRVLDKIYIYGRYEDLDSGVKTIVISEERTRDKNGRSISGEKTLPSNYIVGNEYTNSWFSTQDGMTSFCIEYPIKSGAGFVHIYLTVEDSCGNKSVEEDIPVIVVDKSNFEKTMIYNFTGNPNYFWDYYYDEDRQFDESDFNSNGKKLMVGFRDSFYEYFYTLEETVYDTVTLAGKDLVKYSYCEYVHSNNEYKPDYFTGSWSEGIYTELDVSTLNGLEVRVVIADDLGNTVEQTIKFPSVPENVYYTSDGKYLNCITAAPDVGYYSIETKADSTKLRKSDVELAVGSSYRLWPYYNKSTSEPGDIAIVALYGDIGTTVYSIAQAQTKPDTVELKDDSPSIRKSETAGELIVTLTLEDNQWNKYDTIYAYYYDIYAYVNSAVKYFTSQKPSVEFSMDCQQMFNNDWNFYVVGVKNNIVSDVNKKTITKLNELEADKQILYDNIAPSASLTRTSETAYTFAMRDTISGPKSAYLIKKDGTKKLIADSDTGFTDISIPVKLIDEEALIERVYNEHGIYTFIVFELIDNADTTARKLLPQWSAGGETLPVQDLRKDPDTANRFWFYYHSTLRSGSDGDKYCVSTLSSGGTQWSAPVETSAPSFDWGDSGYEHYYTQYKYKITATDGNWLRMTIKEIIQYSDYYTRANLYNYSIPKYYYAGNPSSGDYDYVLDYGSNAKLIASDSPVFVHTVVTDESYDECSGWSVEKWESAGESKNIKYLYFDTNNTNQKKYTIPDDIESNSCYVVIVHFAGSKTEPYISEVMQK